MKIVLAAIMLFDLIWFGYGVYTLGWDTIMPMWYKLPLLVGIFSIPIILLLSTLKNNS
jgi:hypothetical protein